MYIDNAQMIVFYSHTIDLLVVLLESLYDIVTFSWVAMKIEIEFKT